MSTKLPPFTEPDWSKLPPEAVAWAVDESGDACIYRSVPYIRVGEWDGSSFVGLIETFDMTGIDWRTTLRLRPTEPKPDPHVLADHLHQDEHAELCLRTELEFIAQEFMKALLANPGVFEKEFSINADLAFDAAEAFIAEREKRRSK